MNWGIVLGVLGLVVSLLAVWSVGKVNSSAERLRRKIEENEVNIRQLRELVAEQREDLDEHEEALAGIVTPARNTTGPAVVVYNPTKNADFDYLKTTLARIAADAALPEPVWLPTTADDPGAGQTRQALEMGASVVIAAGGDGTVRNVGEVLAGTGTPLGLLPVGTGNLLARNLSLPFASPHRMALIALTGRESAIDVGWLKIVPHAEPAATEETSAESDGHNGEDSGSPFAKPAKAGTYAFLVNAGLGLDADIMAAAEEKSELKEKLGWLAYVKAAVPHMLAAKMRVKISTRRDMAPVSVEARTVMLLNCGELVGGLVLDPHARPDDGWLELAVLDTRRGIIGWGDLARQVGYNGLGLKPVSIPGFEPSGDIDVHRINAATIVADSPQLVQVDGDVLGRATNISGYIEEGALRVRVP
ncbi:diacylglycerol kinase family protein [Trueperella pyogenes]|uniref:diacylglycerol kinase family protein n=1 Tax=Trueperella pyogenes TaxID=1661 RepID=UPI003132D75A